MADYFTSDHFKLLNRWKGQERDASNPDQNRAYEELKEAYELVDQWAEQLRAKLFPIGVVNLRKRPTNQRNVFQPYCWARIYPAQDSPKGLAYTVRIDADEGFVVKIDTVNFADDSSVRQAYFDLRGASSKGSPFVAVLPAVDGLGKTMAQLVDWSAESIRAFRMRYDEVVEKLCLAANPDDEDILNRFDAKPAFRTFRASWSPADKTLFCRLARAVHASGLDWWHLGKGVQVRFGRKNPGDERAVGVLGLVSGTRARRLVLRREIGGIGLNRAALTQDLVERIEAALASDKERLDEWLALDIERPGLWPDQLRDDPVEGDDDVEEEDLAKSLLQRQPINRIYYGPPGTGKTYELAKLLKRDYEQATGTVSREEWVRQFIADRIASRKWWEGLAMALYDLGESASVDQLLTHPFIDAISAAKGRKDSLRQILWTTLQERTVDESTTVKQKLRFTPRIFDKDADRTWRLVGDWRDACADLVALVGEYREGPRASAVLQHYSFVTFHQSYGYEEFVEGLRPVLGVAAEAGDVQYEIRPGVFKELCRRARLAPDQRFAMVIDEINRGNISKIFGELITLIEPDKREGGANAVSVMLPYSGEAFSVPANVDIVGTMNTADRSLALLDTALRRRFEFVPVLPDTRDQPGAPLHGLRVTAGELVIDVPGMLSAINRRIEALYDRDHCIGHAYFTGLAEVADGDERLVALQQLFSTRVLPLLEEYFFEDWQKIRLILADNQKPVNAQFIHESDDHEGDLVRLFGNEHGLDSYSTKRRYSLNEAAFSDPDAYVGIYAYLDLR